MGREHIVELLEKHAELADKAQDLLDESSSVHREILEEKGRTVWEEKLLSSGAPWQLQSDLGQFNLVSNFHDQPKLVEFLELIPGDDLSIGSTTYFDGVSTRALMPDPTSPPMNILAGPARVDGVVSIIVVFPGLPEEGTLEFCKRMEVPFEIDELRMHYKSMSRQVDDSNKKLQRLKELVDKYS